MIWHGFSHRKVQANSRTSQKRKRRISQRAREKIRRRQLKSEMKKK